MDFSVGNAHQISIIKVICLNIILTQLAGISCAISRYVQSEVNCRVFKPCEGWEITLDARINHRFFGHFYRKVPQNLRKAILIHQSLCDLGDVWDKQ